MTSRSLALFAALAAALALAAHDVGVAWDEFIYFDYSDHVRAWFAAGPDLSAGALADAFAYDTFRNPHPPLLKILSAGTSALTGLPFPLDYRLAHLLSAAGLLALAFHLIGARLGAPHGLLAVAFVVLQPRVFGHVLLATTDATVALTWMNLALLAWRLDQAEDAAERRRLRLLLFAVYGWGVAAKFTGFLALAPVLGFFLWRRRFRELAWAAGAVPWGLLFLVLTSPETWHRPLDGAWSYLVYPLTRESIPISTFYLGRKYDHAPPWHLVDVLTTVTLPLPVLVLLPAAALAPRNLRPLLGSLLCSVAFWALLGHVPRTPRHDGVRQFLALMPVLGLVSWVGAWSLVERVARRWPVLASPRAPAGVAAGLCVLLGLGLWPARLHPLSYYNALIGGLPGAERAGLELSYYLEAVDRPFLREVEGCVGPGQSLGLIPGWQSMLVRYQREGLLRGDIVVEGVQAGRADAVIVVRRRSAFPDDVYRDLRAEVEAVHEGVSLVKLRGPRR